MFIQYTGIPESSVTVLRPSVEKLNAVLTALSYNLPPPHLTFCHCDSLDAANMQQVMQCRDTESSPTKGRLLPATTGNVFHQQQWGVLGVFV
jgi:hypothetical protein